MRKLVAIIVGGGNNGGDGYALAGILKNSDMNGDTGEAELAVRSDLTVSIGCFKQGLFKGRAKEYIGRLTIVDIGISLIDENGEEI